MSSTCPAELARLAERPGWWTPGYVTAQVLLDKHGVLADALSSIVDMPADKARASAASWFGTYLNAFYCWLKSRRRGDELGTRLQAAESAVHLVRMRFVLGQRRPPYHDCLEAQLPTLDNLGFPDGWIRESLLDLVRTGIPTAQHAVEAKIEALLRERGISPVFDAWDPDFHRVKAWSFCRPS